MSRNLSSLIRHLAVLAVSLRYQDGEDDLSIYTLYTHIYIRGPPYKGCHCCVAERIRSKFNMTENKPSFWSLAILAGISQSESFTELLQRESQPA